MTRDQIPETALAWHRAGRGAVLATVVETWGSAPRRAGSQMVVAGDGEMQGSVSGGCVEAAVIAQAGLALRDGRFRVLEFGVSDADAFAVGLACGGRIRVLLEPVGPAIPEGMLADLVAARAARKAVAYVTSLSHGQPRIEARKSHPLRFHTDRSGLEPDGDIFVAVHNPPLRLAVVGAVHIAQALVPMAQATGHDVTVIDPRTAFANAARFPGVTLCDDWPDEALPALGLDARSAVVTLTHDPKLDDPAIEAALAAPVYYLGCLGSTRTHAKRLERLRARGWSGADLARIHGPVGLDIGAQGPAEIALSVLAQITACLRGG